MVDLNDCPAKHHTIPRWCGHGFREDGFDITVPRVMAIFCLSENLTDLKEKLGNIIVAETRDKTPTPTN